MKSPVVKILVSVTDPANFDACTLCFDTLRTGWPTAEIHVDVNAHRTTPNVRMQVLDKAKTLGRVDEVNLLPAEVHHAEWIRQAIETHESDRPLVVLDPDTIFWKSCEEWAFLSGTLLAGYGVPKMWNDFAKCISFPRVHTSLMVFPNVPALRDLIKRAYPWSGQKFGEYCPCDPFMPAVRFIDGVPYFWDTCANLYGMLRGENSHVGAVTIFASEHLACYNHLNSASFADVMKERIGPEWVAKFNQTPGFAALWETTRDYYVAKHDEA